MQTTKTLVEGIVTSVAEIL